MYKFIQRNKNQEQEVIAILHTNLLTWEGDKVNLVKRTLSNLHHTLLGGKTFDITNETHLDLLPLIFNGGYFWVKQEEE